MSNDSSRQTENWFEFTMGELYEKPVYTALWQLKDDVDLDKVYLKLALFMMEFVKFGTSNETMTEEGK